MKIGCHVSIAGGVFNAPGRAKELECETFQIFTRSPQGGPAPELTPEVVENFTKEMQRCSLDEFVVHAPYFINLGSEKKNIYYGSIGILKTELERASVLGARFLMTHLGSFKELGEEKGMEQVAAGLEKVLEEYEEAATRKAGTKFLLEIAAGAGSVVGDTFEELAFLSERLKKFESFGGICFDTQHAFASGYEISTAKGIKETFKKFDSIIGLKSLQMSHINDSKIELGGRKDRHDHIGAGHIGEAGFVEILKFIHKLEQKTKTEKPLILETEHDKVKEDITKLKQLRIQAQA